MAKLTVSNHAVLRWLERCGGVDVEGLRAAIETLLDPIHAAAESIGGGDYLIISAGFVYVVRDGIVTTVMDHLSDANLAGALRPDVDRR